MSEVWKKYKLVLVSLGYAGVVFAVLWIVALPLIGEIRDSSDAMQKLAIDKEMAEAKMARISEMEKEQEELRENQHSMEMLLDSGRQVDFIKKMEALAEKTGNSIDFKIGEAVSKEESKTKSAKKEKEEDDILSKLPYDRYIPMQINLEGTYEGFFNFISRVENFDYYLNVISVKTEYGDSQEKEEALGNRLLSSGMPESSKNKVSSEKPERRKVLKSTLETVVYMQ